MQIDLDLILADVTALTRDDFERMCFCPEAAAEAVSRRARISSSFIWSQCALAPREFWVAARGDFGAADPPHIHVQIVLHTMLSRYEELYGENSNEHADREV